MDVIKFPKITQIPKDFSNINESWKQILLKIGIEGNDHEYYSLKVRKKKQYFHARTSGGKIRISEAKKLEPTANISIERTVDFNQFKCVAQHYNLYISGEKGIRPLIRDNCGLNSSYIISLINEYL